MKKVLLIGSSGNMGQKHYRVLKSLKEEYSLDIKRCDIQGEAEYTNFLFALKDFKPDYVIIATPTHHHAGALKWCVDNKIKNIFVEKPIVSKDHVKFLDKIMIKRNIMVGHIERFNPIVPKIKSLIENKKVHTIICTRSGLHKKKDDYTVDIDLAIHDFDVCQYLIGGNEIKRRTHMNKNNVCDLFYKFNDTEVFLHADNTSIFKRRMIQIIGQEFFIEGDYIEQKVYYNGVLHHTDNTEPLELELRHFIEKKFTNKELKESINNVRMML